MERIFYKKFQAFNLTEIKPEGWLRKQLQVQMDGLTGKLYDIWGDVGSYSGWLGGTGEDWERGPYYLDGLLPIAYLLDDRSKWDLAERFIKWTLKSQDAEGNFGPQGTKSDWWSRVVMLKVLIQYYEITRQEEVLLFMQRYYHFQQKELPRNPLKQWGKARGGDLLYCIKWLYELKPEPYLIELMELVKQQSIDWNEFFTEFPFTRPTEYYYDWEKLSAFSWETITELMQYQETHIVNVTMGLKYPAMIAWLENNKELGLVEGKAIDELKKYHGVVSGAVNGDEHLAGNSPSRGAELCSIVEYMFSLQVIMEIFGEAKYGDILERLAYNALPATITEDYTGHQYLQQANQVKVTNEKRNWFNNLDDSNLFGLEPNFGCCTANMHQGWPKFVKSLWYREGEAIISTVFAPSKLETLIQGKPFVMELKTAYPSDGELSYCVEEAKDVLLELRIRKPEWCETYNINKNGQLIACPEEHGFIILKDTVSSGDCIKIHMEMNIEVSTWKNGSLGIQRGPLVYALDIREEWHVKRAVAGIKDFEILPGSEWNYALCKEPSFEVEEKKITGIPFHKDNPPTAIWANAKKIDTWILDHGSAADVPVSPVSCLEKETERIRLIPFGCTKLRISQFPYCQ